MKHNRPLDTFKQVFLMGTSAYLLLGAGHATRSRLGSMFTSTEEAHGCVPATPGRLA